jgi:hypothetical protein
VREGNDDSGSIYVASCPDAAVQIRSSSIAQGALDFSPDQQALVANCGGALRVLDVRTGSLVWNLATNGGGGPFCVSPNGRHIYQCQGTWHASQLWDISCIYGARPKWL